MRITLGTGAKLFQSNPPGPPPGARMSNHTDRSGTTIHGWAAVLFGVPFAGAGLAIIGLSAMGRMTPSGSAPVWLLMVSGVLFASVGLWIIVHGARGIGARSRAAARREASPREPWAWDHPWSPFGSPDDSGRTIGRVIGFTIFSLLLLAPFNWVSFFSGEERIAFKMLTGAFDLMIVGTGAWAVYLIARRRKYGVGMLRFRRFPFLTGGEVEVTLLRSGPLAQLESLEATLRCVQERYETQRRGGKSESRVVCYEVWSEVRRSDAGDGRRSTGREFTWRFLVPESVPGTSLSERPPRYWELEVKAEMPGVDYRATFLVPVYEGTGGERVARLAG